MTKHELIEINDFKVILNHDSEAKTTMVESYISSGFINENIENAGISHLLNMWLLKDGQNVVKKDVKLTGKRKAF